MTDNQPANTPKENNDSSYSTKQPERKISDQPANQNSDDLREQIKEALRPLTLDDVFNLSDEEKENKRIDAISQLIDQAVLAGRIAAYEDCGSKAGLATEVRTYAKSRSAELNKLTSEGK